MGSMSLGALATDFRRVRSLCRDDDLIGPGLVRPSSQCPQGGPESSREVTFSESKVHKPHSELPLSHRWQPLALIMPHMP